VGLRAALDRIPVSKLAEYVCVRVQLDEGADDAAAEVRRRPLRTDAPLHAGALTDQYRSGEIARIGS
jgi:hypothetical protein